MVQIRSLAHKLRHAEAVVKTTTKFSLNMILNIIHNFLFVILFLEIIVSYHITIFENPE